MVAVNSKQTEFKCQQIKFILAQKHASYTTSSEVFMAKYNFVDKAHPLFDKAILYLSMRRKLSIRMYASIVLEQL